MTGGSAAGEEQVEAPMTAAVTTLELFFDLVFVFAITQLTATIGQGRGLVGIGQTVVLLLLLWWMYGGYAWLTNAAPPVTARRRILLLLGMIGNFVCALAVSHAYTVDRWTFAAGYALVVAVHSGMYLTEATRVTRGMIVQSLGWNTVGVLLVLAGAWAGGAGLVWWWIAALFVQFVLARFVVGRLESDGAASFDLVPAHFVERHGLMLIIVLGESVLAIGVGVGRGATRIGPEQIVFAAIALILAATLYFAYFGTHEDEHAERALESADARRTQVIGLVAFGYAFVVLLFGVVLAAAGLHHALLTPLAALPAEFAAQLACGIGIFCWGLAWFRHTVGRRGVLARIAVGTILVALTPLGVFGSGLAELVAVLLVITAFLALDTRRERQRTVRP